MSWVGLMPSPNYLRILLELKNCGAVAWLGLLSSAGSALLKRLWRSIALLLEGDAGRPIINTVLVSDFDYQLPEELIAQEPLADRSASRMLHLHRQSGRFEDQHFADFPELVHEGDLVVVNNSRVFPARLFGRRSGLHAHPVSHRNPTAKEFLQGRVEVLLTRQLGPLEWEGLVRPGRKLGVGEKIVFGQEAELEAEIVSRGEFGERTLRFGAVPDFFGVIEKLGHVPLPPYIARQDRSEDRERYQTVYARPEARGSVAAPTAGLHFTPG